MKKLTLFLSAMLLACATNLWATETKWTWTAAASGDLGTTTPANVTLNGKAWTVTRSSVQHTGFISTNCIQLGKKGGAETVTLTSSAFAGTIKSVAVECASYSGNHTIAISVGEISYLAATATSSWETVGTKTGTGTASGDITITFTAGSGARALYIKSITVVTESVDPNTVATPTVTVTGTEVNGSYITSANVEIACTTEGAAISYSTDKGTTWNPYTTALTITKTTTLQAKATKAEMTASAVATKNITIIPSIANTQETALTTAAAKALIDATSSAQLAAEKVYVKGTISKIDSYNETYKSLTYWLDNNTFEVYSGKGLDNADFASLNDIAVGGEVIIYGNIKKLGSTYEFDYNNYLVSYTAPENPKYVATITLGEYQYTLAAETYDEYTVTYNGDGKLSVTSSNEEVAEAEIVDGTVLVYAKAPGKTTITFSAPETERYFAAEKTYTLTVTVAWAAAALPFEFNGGKAAIDNIVGIKGVGLGSDYASAPYLKFDTANDSLLIWYNDKANTLAYTIKGYSFSNGGTFDVKESTDGATFTTIDSIKTIGGSATEKKSTLKEASRFVLFTYTTKSSGNVALGGIKISYVSNPTAINNAAVETPAVKTIENGQLVILRDGVKYNAMGVRLQ